MTRSGITGLALCLSFLIASATLRAPAAAQSLGAADADDLLAVMERLSLKLPTNVSGSDPVRQYLWELSRERCDQTAITNLGKALENAGYRREASTALVRYSETCGGHAPALRAALDRARAARRPFLREDHRESSVRATGAVRPPQAPPPRR